MLIALTSMLSTLTLKCDSARFMSRSTMTTIYRLFTCLGRTISRHFATLPSGKRYGGSNGPLAAIGSEPRQARKGATVVIKSGAEVWLFESPPYNHRAHYELSSSCAKVETIQLLRDGRTRARSQGTHDRVGVGAPAPRLPIYGHAWCR